MTITRVFRVEIDPDLREEFEAKFATVSVHIAESADGNRSVTILRPTKWAPNEYAMISEWRNESALRKFVGENWNRGVIPKQMEEFVQTCSVHHYESWN
jgi:heme-degrading monooxygenase HmoA